MTSKNSFLASLKENNKRRIWVWIVAIFGFVVILPSAVTMALSQTKNEADFLIEIYGETLGKQMLQNELFAMTEALIGVKSGDMWFFVAAFAILAGIQGFSYLYNKRKIDFYMGMPVKRKKRFLVIWLNGILMFAVPYLSGIVISLLIAASNGALNGEILMSVWKAFGLQLCLYLGVYHLVILAVMLTGNVIITFCAVAVLFLYELGVRVIIMGYMSLFFKFYSYRDFGTSPILSPFTIFFEYRNDVYNRGVGNIWLTVLYLLLFAAAAWVLSYICYLKRPAEVAGKAIAFSWLKPWLKVLVAVPVALMAGVLTSGIVGYEPLYGRNNSGIVFFVMAVALLFTCCLMQVIYEFDIKGILHKKRHILVSSIAVILFLAVFRYDVFGYDSYIPDVEKVESVAIATPIVGSYYYTGDYFDEDMNYLSRAEYVDKYMYFFDVGAVNKLMKLSMDAVNSYDNFDEMYADEEREWYTVQLTYRMANKSKVYRDILIDLSDAETQELIDRIESSEEYISGSYIGASDIVDKVIADENKKISVFYGVGLYKTMLKREETKELLALYKEDILNSSFVRHRESIPAGSLVVSIEEQHSNYTSTRQVGMEIYPFYEKCVSYLREKGYYMDTYLNSDDIERIQIVNVNLDLVEAAREQRMLEGAETEYGTEAVMVETTYASTYPSVMNMEEEEFKTYFTYEDDKEIQALSESLYPDGMLYSCWHMQKEYDENYTAVVYFKPESKVSSQNDSIAYYRFAKGEVPEFVIEDTLYKE